MKKILALTLGAALCLSFVACGGEGKEPTTSNEPENTVVTDEVVTDEVVTDEVITDEVTAFVEAPANSAEDAAKEIEKLLASLKAGDAETIISLSGSDAAREDELLLEMLVALFAQLEYKVGEPNITGDNTATLPVEIKAVSITSVFTEYMVEAAKHIDEENWDDDGSEFIKICRSDKVSKQTENVDVNLERGTDGTWRRGADNEAFINALFGGLL